MRRIIASIIVCLVLTASGASQTPTASPRPICEAYDTSTRALRDGDRVVCFGGLEIDDYKVKATVKEIVNGLAIAQPDEEFDVDHADLLCGTGPSKTPLRPLVAFGADDRGAWRLLRPAHGHRSVRHAMVLMVKKPAMVLLRAMAQDGR